MNLKKLSTLAIAGVAALGVTGSALANVCAFDTVPAATLLYPFVAFDYNNPIDGVNTNIAVTNVSNTAQIVHFTVWTDSSQAILDFNVVLSGYDVQTMNMRDIFFNGLLPDTGTSGALNIRGGIPADDGPMDVTNGLLPDAGDTSSLSSRCSSGDPGYPNYPVMPNGTLQLFQGLLMESQTVLKLHGDCATASTYLLSPSDWYQDRSTADATWMYLTADVVESCNRFFPDTDALYWDTEVRDDNVLMGDVLWTNSSARFSEADNAVHIEADANLAAVANTDLAGNPISFYYRYSTNNLLTPDNREPLPTAWGFRYFGAGEEALGTYIRAWKGSTTFSTIDDLLTTPSAWIAWDCLAYTYYAWDEDENVISVSENPWSQPGAITVRPNLLPLETQEVSIDQFNTVGSKGWMLFVWHPSNGDVGADIWQTWMGVKYTAFETFSAHMGATVMANWGCFGDQTLPWLGVNYDYVDSNGYCEDGDVCLPEGGNRRN